MKKKQTRWFIPNEAVKRGQRAGRNMNVINRKAPKIMNDIFDELMPSLKKTRSE